MNKLEILRNLLSSAESLTYGDNESIVRDRAYMVFKNIFGEDCNYNTRIYNIRFEPRENSNMFDEGYEEYCESVWLNGKQDLINEIKVATEEYEMFIMVGNSKPENPSLCQENYSNRYNDLFYTVTKYLSEQDTSLDKNTAFLLNYADFYVKESTQYSNRMDCVWATAIIKLPMKLKSKFNEEMKKRLIEVLNDFRPSEWSIDFSDIFVQPKIEKPYDNWRDDVLKKLLGEGVNNQASFKSTSHPMIEYKGLKFRSKSEMSLAPIFEEYKVLFFPLPIAVCGTERKEPDYLVCKNGKWAILEVVADFTHSSVEKEADRTNWFQKHYIQVKQYSAQKCYNNPKSIIDEFLQWMEGL